MKLFVHIPCLNEAEFIADVVRSIPRNIDGFSKVNVLVIDDGSTDDTAERAEAAGADYVLRNPVNMGLAYTYIRGLEECIERGADVILNYDADAQYKAECIPALTKPILEGKADLVVGVRPIRQIEHFSPAKKVLQGLGSTVVRKVSGVLVEDAPSGFRAITRKAASHLFVFNGYTYTLETLIQAGQAGIAVTTVPIEVNPPIRPSRLMRNSTIYILKSAATILRVSFLYRPFKIMLWLALFTGLPALVAIVRFLIAYAAGEGNGMVQSLVLGGALLVVSTMLLVGGMLAELLAANRRILQDTRARQLLGRGAVKIGPEPR
ncbi:glycosyltransferase family 2 protein [Litorisediminicola beolgyonensis]|uniref:Glycosyltransferase family 2 protein n=1 Tax=Litorisediminicola beolgyonensis TaxID=1173614 RepID=A0ABW3ZMA0_9RHOB